MAFYFLSSSMENGVKKTIFQTLFLHVEEVRENWRWCLSVEECDMAIREKIFHCYHSLFFLSNFHYNCRSLTVHFYMFINLYMYLSSISIYPYIQPFIYLSIYPSIFLSFYLSRHQPLRRFIKLWSRVLTKLLNLHT